MLPPMAIGVMFALIVALHTCYYLFADGYKGTGNMFGARMAVAADGTRPLHHHPRVRVQRRSRVLRARLRLRRPRLLAELRCFPLAPARILPGAAARLVISAGAGVTPGCGGRWRRWRCRSRRRGGCRRTSR